MPIFCVRIHGQSAADNYLQKAKVFQQQKKLDSAIICANLCAKNCSENNLKTLCAAKLLIAQCSNKIAPREAIYLYFEAAKIAKKISDKPVLFRSYLSIGAIYRRESKFDSAKWHYNHCVQIANELINENKNNENLKRLGMVYNNFGAFYSELEQYPKAAYYLTETERIGHEINDTGMMFRAAVNAGGIFNDLGNPENKLSHGFTQKMYLQKAIIYFKRALNLLTKEDLEYRPSLENNLAISYISLNNYDSAIILLEKVLAIYRKNSVKEKLCFCELNLGTAYQKVKQYGKAENLYTEAINWAEKNNDLHCKVSVMSNQGQLYTELNRLNDAENTLTKALELKKNMPGQSRNYLLYEKLYLLYEKMKKYEKAFSFYKLFVAQKDSISDISHLNILDDLEMKYDTEKKEELIQDLSLEKQLLIEKNRARDTEIRLRNFIIFGIIAFFVLLGIIAWLRVKQNKLVEIQQKADLEYRLLRAQMNPHFLFNGLNTIQKHYEDGNIENANLFLTDFSKFLRQILNKTGQTQHSLEDEINFTKLYISLEQRKYPDQILFKLIIADGISLEDWLVPSLILQPIVENAIWHGILPKKEPCNLIIEINENRNNELIISINDDGVGIANTIQREGHESKALQLIQQRIGKKGTVTFESMDQNSKAGTVVTIKLKSN